MGAANFVLHLPEEINNGNANLGKNMLHNSITDMIRTGDIIERAVKRRVSIALEEFRYGYYITCIHPAAADAGDGTIVQIETGAHWILMPDGDDNSRWKPRKMYAIRFAPVAASIEFSKDNSFFTTDSVLLSGQILKECFIRGFLSEKKTEKLLKTVYITCDLYDMRNCVYYAYRQANNKLILKNSNLEALFGDLVRSGYTRISITQKSGIRKTYKLADII